MKTEQENTKNTETLTWAELVRRNIAILTMDIKSFSSSQLSAIENLIKIGESYDKMSDFFKNKI